MSIHYTVPGFEPTTNGHESLPITTRPRALQVYYSLLLLSLLVLIRFGNNVKINLTDRRRISVILCKLFR